MSTDNVVPFVLPKEDVDLPHMQLMLEIARVAHESICGVRVGFGRGDCPPWKETTPQERMAAAQMVITLVRRPHWTADQFHSDYCNDMKSQGWSFGEEYDAERKLTPMLVDYDQLPIEQRMEDQVFRAVVFALYFKED